MGARSPIPWSSFTKLHGNNTSFFLEGGLFWIICLLRGALFPKVGPQGMICCPNYIFLFRTRFVRYLMAIWCMCFNSVFTLDLDILRRSHSLVKCSRTASLAPVVMV